VSGRERLGLQQWRVRANSFGPAAELYDRVRPSYPSEAIEWALSPLGAGAWRVMDVGAGTGIMTRQLVALGHEVIAVEPDEQMRARLAQTTLVATPLAGRAEAIPLPDASVDGAVAAQAYHWFDRDRAHEELARVIRPGGVFAAVWNTRDEAEPWVAEYSRIVEGARRGQDASRQRASIGGPTGLSRGPRGDVERSGASSWGGSSGASAEASEMSSPPAVPDGPDVPRPALNFGGSFADTELATFHHEATHTVETLVTLMQSRSYYIVASPEGRGELEAEVRQLVATHPDLAGRTRFPLRYKTEVHRAVRLG